MRGPLGSMYFGVPDAVSFRVGGLLRQRLSAKGPLGSFSLGFHKRCLRTGSPRI